MLHRFLFPGTSKKQRSPYRCSKCGLEGHNSRNCLIEVEAFDSNSIVAGKYVVNEFPFKALGKLHEYQCLLGGEKNEKRRKRKSRKLARKMKKLRRYYGLY